MLSSGGGRKFFRSQIEMSTPDACTVNSPLDGCLKGKVLGDAEGWQF
jgi:hypothetical protein